MGKNNKQRRADKKRQRAQRGPGPAAGGAGLPSVTEKIRIAVFDGAMAAARGDEAGLEDATGLLGRLAPRVGSGRVTATAGETLTDVLAGLWEDGWQPAEVHHQVGRRGRDAQARLVAAALGAPGTWQEADGAPMPQAWSAQLEALGVHPVGAGDWLAGRLRAHRPLAEELVPVLVTLGALLCLPPITVLSPPPSGWRSAGVGATAADDPVLAKVRGLLAKAESTTFEAEAEALTAKAQELMARHAIDDAVARATRASGEEPIARRVAVEDPYAEAKSRLLAVVARHNGAETVWYEDFAMMALVGFRADLDAVEVLFTSLLVQAGRSMHHQGSVTDREGRSRTRSFRQSFLVAFAGRIAERLAVAAITAQREAEGEHGDRLLPALADRDHEVAGARARWFPHTTPGTGLAVTNRAGQQAGRTAAELATLGPERDLLAEARRAG